MLDAALSRIPLVGRFTAIYIVLGAIAIAAAFAFTAGLLSHAPTYTQTRIVHLDATQTVHSMTAIQLVAALGKPDQQQTQTSGILCSVWQARKLEVCYQP